MIWGVVNAKGLSHVLVEGIGSLHFFICTMSGQCAVSAVISSCVGVCVYACAHGLLRWCISLLQYVTAIEETSDK